MTDDFRHPPIEYRRRPPVRRTGRDRVSTAALTTRLVFASIALALLITAGLAVQMASGSDPALGPKQRKAASQATGTTDSTSAPAPSEPLYSQAAPAPQTVAPQTVAPPAPVTSTVS